MLPTKLWYIWPIGFREDLKNSPIINKNCLWRPHLLTDRNKMTNLYSGHAIGASYQVSVHLAKRFKRKTFLESTNQKKELTAAAVCNRIGMK